MPLPRVRFTVRRMMIAVAIAAAVTTGLHYRRLSAGRAQLGSDFRIAARLWEGGRDRHGRALSPRAGEYARRRVDHYNLLAEKYERAARYPWLSVTPGPLKLE